MSSSGKHEDLKSSISVILFGLGLAAFIVTMCHCINNRRRSIAALQRPRPGNNNAETPSSIEISTAQLIPAYKYYKGMGLVDDDGDTTCVICLQEFQEGEELRTLPECLHSYHVPCIDMWFNSHSNCPMCRTDAMSTPHDLSHLTEFNSHGPVTEQNLGMPQNIAVVH